MEFLKDLFSRVPKEPSVVQPQRQGMFVDFAEHVLKNKRHYSRELINEATNVVMDDFYKEFERMMG